VQVRRNGILAACNTVDCDYQFTPPGSVTGLSPTSFDVLAALNILTITGTKLRKTNRVTIGGMECVADGTFCTIVSTAADEVVVEFSNLPYGNLTIAVYTEHGKTKHRQSVQSEFITVAAQPVSVFPTEGTLNGGNIVTLTGAGVGLGDDQVMIGNSNPQVARTISRVPNELVIQTPPGESLGAADVSFSNGIIIATYTYRNSQKVAISLSKTDFSVKGESAILVTFDQVLTKTVTMLIEDVEHGSYDLDASATMTIDMPAHSPGKGMKLKFHVPGHGWTNSLNVRYRLTLDSVTPSASSTAGGALTTILGRGFGSVKSDAAVTIGGLPCDIESIRNIEIICRTRSYYQEHHVFLTGSSWYPQRLTVKQNDIISWTWLTVDPINVEIQSVDGLAETDPNGIFSVPKKTGNSGTVSRFMAEAPGVYHYSSGFLDDLFSQFANGEITVETAIDYQVDVSVKIVGFEAMVEAGWRGEALIPRAGKTCAPVETDIANKDPSELVLSRVEKILL